MSTHAIITNYKEAKNTNSGFIKAVCVKMQIEDYEISIAYDNSIGALEHCRRADLKIFRECDGSDITKEIIGKDAIYHVSPKEIADAIYACIKKTEEDNNK